jgi:glycosyltransferase involved in cell wall biosynthesis
MISIVTPSYQQLDWLRLALASVADQEGVDVEHIVQDGGSAGAEDMFREMVGSSAQPHQSARLFVEKDSGMYDAINRGLRRASGEICAYLNCDEQYLPGALSEVANYFATHPEIDVLFGDAVLVNAKGVPLSYRRVTLPSLVHLRLADLNTLTCATFFRHRLVDAGHLFPSHLKIAGDQYWVFQLLKSGIKMGVLQKPLSVFTFTGSNLSHTAGAGDERFGWLPAEEKPSRWLRPLVVVWHRLRKFVAGAYRWRTVTLEIYTQDQPDRRRKISSLIGFRWPITVRQSR